MRWTDATVRAALGLGDGDDTGYSAISTDTRIMELMSGQGIRTHLDVTQEMTDEAWHRMIAVHLNGTFFCTREALTLMSRRDQGVIINLSSVAPLATGTPSCTHKPCMKCLSVALANASAGGDNIWMSGSKRSRPPMTAESMSSGSQPRGIGPPGEQPVESRAQGGPRHRDGGFLVLVAVAATEIARSRQDQADRR